MTIRQRISTIETELLDKSFTKAFSESNDYAILYYPEKNLLERESVESTVLDITYDVIEEISALRNEVPNLSSLEIPCFKIVVNDSSINLFEEEIENYTQSLEMRQRAWYRSAGFGLLGVLALEVASSVNLGGVVRSLGGVSILGAIWYVGYSGLDKFIFHHSAKLEALKRIEVISADEILSSKLNEKNSSLYVTS